MWKRMKGSMWKTYSKEFGNKPNCKVTIIGKHILCIMCVPWITISMSKHAHHQYCPSPILVASSKSFVQDLRHPNLLFEIWDLQVQLWSGPSCHAICSHIPEAFSWNALYESNTQRVQRFEHSHVWYVLLTFQPRDYINQLSNERIGHDVHTPRVPLILCIYTLHPILQF